MKRYTARVSAVSAAASMFTRIVRWMSAMALSSQPMPNAAEGLTRPEGRGRSAVRCMRESGSISMSWLNTAAPNAASVLPTIV